MWFQLLGRTLRVDHVEEYRKPKEHGDEDEVTMKLRNEGCAPQIPQSPELSPEEDPLTLMKKGSSHRFYCDSTINHNSTMDCLHVCLRCRTQLQCI